MSAKIHYLGGNPTPIELFIRVGHSGHRQLETLHSAGHVRLQHIVVDAAQIDAQSDLVKILWDAGIEVVLDTNVAELSSLGRFGGAAQKLAWANTERPLKPSDFNGSKKRRIIENIAEFSVAHKVDTVLAPTHLIKSSRDEWMRIDMWSCELLREALDQAGGKDISIDYPLIVPYSTLRDSAHRRTLVSELANLPFENLWMRVSGFGADASPVGVRRFIANVADLHALGKPVIADYVGGLAALGIIAFGAAGAICHGVANKERFETGNWNARTKKGGGGQNGRLYLPGLDRHFKLKDAELIIKAKGGRRLLACQDRDCCPLGLEDMIRNPKAHFLTQRRKQLKDLEKTHDDRRVTRFLDYHLTAADRTARQAAKLTIDNNAIPKTLQKGSIRLDRMRGVLEDLDQTIGPGSTRSKPLATRTSILARSKHRRK